MYQTSILDPVSIIANKRDRVPYGALILQRRPIINK